jgi:diacylglycerol O-acyltransferase 2, plant
MMRLLRHSSVGVIVEGIAGVFHGACPEAERVYLSRRKGFVKAAMQAGAQLVPVYHLGASQVLSFAGNGSLSRRWRLTVAAYWGERGLPLPRRHDIISVVGKPIPVVQDDAPSQDAIDALHARFTAALVDLFDGHKHLLGPEWAAKTLEVV